MPDNCLVQSFVCSYVLRASGCKAMPNTSFQATAYGRAWVIRPSRTTPLGPSVQSLSSALPASVHCHHANFHAIPLRPPRHSGLAVIAVHRAPPKPSNASASFSASTFIAFSTWCLHQAANDNGPSHEIARHFGIAQAIHPASQSIPYSCMSINQFFGALKVVHRTCKPLL